MKRAPAEMASALFLSFFSKKSKFICVYEIFVVILRDFSVLWADVKGK